MIKHKHHNQGKRLCSVCRHYFPRDQLLACNTGLVCEGCKERIQNGNTNTFHT